MMYVTLFLLGLTGSLHCAGMCSPLAMAVSSGKPLWNRFIYNTGRVLTYGFLGAVAAQLGQLTVLSAYRSYLSVAMGIIILLTGLGLISGRVPWLTNGLARFAALLKKTFGQVIQRKSLGHTFVLGVINGFIPCGVSGMALAYCFILPNASTGFLTMIAFGMGTWPMMLFYPFIMKTIGGMFRLDLRKATVVMMVVSGVLMIGNGIWSQSTLSITAVSPSANMILCP